MSHDWEVSKYGLGKLDSWICKNCGHFMVIDPDSDADHHLIERVTNQGRSDGHFSCQNLAHLRIIREVNDS